MLKLEGVGFHAAGAPSALLHEAELEVSAGEVRVVFGDSGVGKSSVLRMFAGQLAPDRGVVRALERDLARLRVSSLRRLLRRVVLIDEVPRFFEDRTAFANVSIALEIVALPKQEIRTAAAGALARVGLGERMEVLARDLSRSERLWLALARALAREPDVILADEPWRELDELGRDRLCTLLDELAAAGAACLVTTSDHHTVELAELWGWGVSEMREGKLLPFHEVAPALEHEVTDDQVFDVEVDIGAVEIEDSGLADVLPFPVKASASGALG